MLALTITLLLLGAALATRGLIGRRIGDELRCRKCKYNLTGVESSKCPECGRPWTAATAARGLRFKRKRPLALGLLLLLIGAALCIGSATGIIRRTNWFTHLPTAWVISGAAHGSTDAFSVLAARYDNAALSPKHLHNLIEAGLAAQADPQFRPTTQDWINLIARIEANGKLAPEQRDRFFRQMVLLDWAVRSPASRNRWIEAEVRKRGRAPTNSVYLWHAEGKSFTVDGQAILQAHAFEDRLLIFPIWPRGQGPLSDPASTCFLPLTRDIHPGIHQLAIPIVASIENPYGSQRSRTPIWSGTQTLSATVEVIEGDSPPPKTSADDPELKTKIVESLEFRATAYPTRRGNPQSIVIEWRLVKPSPCDAWIDVRTRPMRRGLYRLVDFDGHIYLPQGFKHDDFATLAVIESPKRRPGQTLGLWLYSEARSRSGAGSIRLKEGIKFDPIEVTVEAGGVWPTTSPSARTP